MLSSVRRLFVITGGLEAVEASVRVPMQTTATRTERIIVILLLDPVKISKEFILILGFLVVLWIVCASQSKDGLETIICYANANIVDSLNDLGLLSGEKWESKRCFQNKNKIGSVDGSVQSTKYSD